MEERQTIDERKITELFRQTGDSIQAILDYFRLKNKVLWEGKVAANMGTNPKVSAPGLSKYRLVAVDTTYGSFVSDITKGIICGIHSDYTGGNNTLYTDWAYGTISGEVITWLRAYYIGHTPNGSHSTMETMYITKVTGIEPLLPDSLKKIAGGGVVHRLLSRLRYARGCAA